MFRDFAGSIIILTCTMLIGVDVPVIKGTDCYFILALMLFLGVAFGTYLLVNNAEEGQRPQNVSPAGNSPANAITRKYVEQQARRDSRQKKSTGDFNA